MSYLRSFKFIIPLASSTLSLFAADIGDPVYDDKGSVGDWERRSMVEGTSTIDGSTLYSEACAAAGLDKGISYMPPILKNGMSLGDVTKAYRKLSRRYTILSTQAQSYQGGASAIQAELERLRSEVETLSEAKAAVDERLVAAESAAQAELARLRSEVETLREVNADLEGRLGASKSAEATAQTEHERLTAGVRESSEKRAVAGESSRAVEVATQSAPQAGASGSSRETLARATGYPPMAAPATIGRGGVTGRQNNRANGAAGGNKKDKGCSVM